MQRQTPQREQNKAQEERDHPQNQTELVEKPLPIPEDLPPQQRAVLEALAGEEMEFDALCEALAMDGAELGVVLMELEMDGFIDALPGLRYARRA